jgi:hypothetical protein
VRLGVRCVLGNELRGFAVVLWVNKQGSWEALQLTMRSDE